MCIRDRTELDIVYEDSYVLFVNKPAGMLSQKAEKDDVSLVEYITGYLLKKMCIRDSGCTEVHASSV